MTQKSKHRAYTRKELEEIGNFLTDRQIKVQQKKTAAGFLSIIFLILTALSAFTLPSEFIEIKNFNGYVAFVFFVISLIYMLISKLTPNAPDFRNYENE